MEVRFWAQTDVGRQRDHNEDNFLVDKKLNLFIVADGMGGHAAGEVASAAAVHEVRRFLVERQGKIRANASQPGKENPLEINALLEAAVQHACARIHQLAQNNAARRGMGTTVEVLLVAGGRGFIAHVGDSRVYMLRQGKIHQMTQDHSLVNELIRRGRLKPGQAFESPLKNAVTRAVGVYPSVDVDTMDFDILAGDRFLLCSDGLAGYLDAAPDALLDRLGQPGLEQVTSSLIHFANDAGGKDNITALVVEALPESEEMASLLAAEQRMKLEALQGIPLIRYLTYRELVKLLGITETTEHAAGERVIEEGDPGDRFFVLLEGRVRVFKGDVAIADLEAGAHFGEMALVDSAPRSATIRALTPCRTLSIPREKFYDLMRHDSQLAVKMLWGFVQVLTVRLRLSSLELAERMTEQDMVARMEPLFHDAARPTQGAVPGEPREEPHSSDANSLAPEEVQRVRSDADVLVPEGTLQVLEEEGRRITRGSLPVAASVPAGETPTPVERAAPVPASPSRPEQQLAVPPDAQATSDPAPAPAGREQDAGASAAAETLPAVPPVADAVPAARPALPGRVPGADDEEDDIDTSPGRSADPAATKRTPS